LEKVDGQEFLENIIMGLRRQESDNTYTMTKKQTLGLAAAVAALLAGSQAQAQFTFANGDLLLNFRDVSSTGDADVTVDVGNVNTFVSTIAALPGCRPAGRHRRVGYGQRRHSDGGLYRHFFR
jgi:hypothetical protein